MAKREKGLGDSIAAQVKAQVKGGVDELRASIDDAVVGLGAAARLGTDGVGTGIREAVASATAGIGDAVASATANLASIGPLVTAAVRDVTDVDTLKALADPTRLAILRVLMPEMGSRLPVMSAKELAEALGEPQTKLYRHLKVLEAAGLIEVAETRVVSGIVETRYRAAQSGLQIEPNTVEEAGEEFLAVVSAMISNYRDELVKLAMADRVPVGDVAPEGYGRGVMMSGDKRMPIARADELRKRLIALIDEFDAEPSDPDGIQVNMLSCWYTPLPDGEAATP